MAQTVDMVITAHVHLEIADGVEATEQMMAVTRHVETVLIDAAQRKRLDTDDAKASVGKILGVGVPR